MHACFAEWVETIRETISGEIVAVDGKTIRRSKDNQKRQKPLHVVSAWANQNRLVLGEIATEEKSNEITAIPALLKLLNIKGCIVTIDAMGTQKEIAKTIIKESGDYVLALKENHRDFYEDVQLYFKEEMLPRNKLDLEKDGRYAKTVEKSHGRYDMAAMKRGSVICQAKLTGWKIGEIRKSCGESVSSYLHVKLQESRKLAQPCTISSTVQICRRSHYCMQNEAIGALKTVCTGHLICCSERMKAA